MVTEGLEDDSVPRIHSAPSFFGEENIQRSTVLVLLEHVMSPQLTLVGKFISNRGLKRSDDSDIVVARAKAEKSFRKAVRSGREIVLYDASGRVG